MATWIILLLSILIAVLLGLIGGAIIGKHIVKRQKSPRQALLSPRERVAYTACVLFGAVIILLGVFYKPPVKGADTPPGGITTEDGVMVFADGNAAEDSNETAVDVPDEDVAAKETAIAVAAG